jgi:hypothetical protein
LLSIARLNKGYREPDVPEERRIRFRIGVNLGGVIVEEHDIFGRSATARH